jgi:hypothetical protein
VFLAADTDRANRRLGGAAALGVSSYSPAVLGLCGRNSARHTGCCSESSTRVRVFSSLTASGTPRWHCMLATPTYCAGAHGGRCDVQRMQGRSRRFHPLQGQDADGVVSALQQASTGNLLNLNGILEYLNVLALPIVGAPCAGRCAIACSTCRRARTTAKVQRPTRSLASGAALIRLVLECRHT